jgi:hypothetical protein
MSWIYLSAMVLIGAATYGCAFLFLPIPALRTEAQRWRQAIAGALHFPRRPPT